MCNLWILLIIAWERERGGGRREKETPQRLTSSKRKRRLTQRRKISFRQQVIRRVSRSLSPVRIHYARTVTKIWTLITRTRVQATSGIPCQNANLFFTRHSSCVAGPPCPSLTVKPKCLCSVIPRCSFVSLPFTGSLIIPVPVHF